MAASKLGATAGGITLGAVLIGGITYSVDEIQEVNDNYIIEQSESIDFDTTFIGIDVITLKEGEVLRLEGDNGTLTYTYEELKARDTSLLADDLVSITLGHTFGTSTLSVYINNTHLKTRTEKFFTEETTKTINTTIKDITLDDFAIIEKQVAFGEEYHIGFSVFNEWNYDITKARINEGAEVNLSLESEYLEYDNLLLTMTNTEVDSLVLEQVSQLTITDLYVGDQWIDIDDWTGEHILRTIDNNGYENDIKQLQDLIDEKEAELQNINNQITTQQTNLDFINQQIAEGNGDLDALNEQKAVIESDIAELETEKSELQGLIVSYNQVISDKEEQIRIHEETINELHETIDRLEEERLSYRPWYKKIWDWTTGIVHGFISIPGNIVKGVMEGFE